MWFSGPLRFGLIPLPNVGICCWNGTSGRESWRKDVEIKIITWDGGDATVPTPPQQGQGSSLSLGKGKRQMFKD